MPKRYHDLTLGLAPSKNTPNLPRWKVVRDGRFLRRAAVLLGFTEVQDAGQDAADMKRGLAGFWAWAAATVKWETPIAYLPRFLALRSGTWSKVHGGRDTVSPTRGRSEAEFWPIVRRAHRKDLAFTVLVEHYTAFARSNHFRKGTPSYLWVRAMWRVNFRATKARVLVLHRLGRTVFVMGDYNDARMPLYHPDQVWLVQDGICKIGVIVGAKGPTVRRLKSWKRDQPGGDHDALFVRVRLTARAVAA